MELSCMVQGGTTNSAVNVDCCLIVLSWPIVHQTLSTQLTGLIAANGIEHLDVRWTVVASVGQQPLRIFNQTHTTN